MDLSSHRGYLALSGDTGCALAVNYSGSHFSTWENADGDLEYNYSSSEIDDEIIGCYMDEPKY